MYKLTITEKSIFSYFLFTYISSHIFPLSFLYTFLLVFSLIFVCNSYLGILSSVIWITCPSHLNVIFWKPCLILSTSNSNLILVIFILSKIIIIIIEDYSHNVISMQKAYCEGNFYLLMFRITFTQVIYTDCDLCIRES